MKAMDIGPEEEANVVGKKTNNNIISLIEWVDARRRMADQKKKDVIHSLTIYLNIFFFFSYIHSADDFTYQINFHDYSAHLSETEPDV